MNKTLFIAFDVDGTLIHQVGSKVDTPRYDIISLYNAYQALGCTMIVWSGGGIDYATRWAEKLGLQPDMVIEKGSKMVDIAFDDMEIKLGVINVRI